MSTRTALLNGNVINRDADFSKYIEAVSEPGVISGFTVSSSSVSVGEAFVKCERTNGDTIYAVVYNNSAQSISGNGDVYIEIPQELIDNGELANEDGSEIAEIKVGTMPSKNAIKLAIINNGVVEDKRNIIKKVGELNALISENISDIIDLDNRVGELEEAEAINHLEDSSFVGELYSLSNELFKQITPTLDNSTIDCNVGDLNENTQIHIQRIGSGVESNQIKLKVKKIGSPTTSLVVEVRKGIKVDVSANEAYRYGGGDLIATGSISYSNISATYAEKTITLDANFGGTKGELLDVIVHQTNNTVNNANYFSIACDKTQYSEGLSYVKVNGDTRVRSREIPYCVSDGLSNTILAKKGIIADLGIQTSISLETDTIIYTANKSGQYKFTCGLYRSNSNGSTNLYLAKNGSASSGGFVSFNNDIIGTKQVEAIFDLKEGDVLHAYAWKGGYGESSINNMKLYSEKSPQNAIPLKPIEVKNIGEVGYGTSYGIHSGDGIFYGGYMIKKTNGATTGNITLGNAVGFIEVNFNGEIIKIPYYS